jgi:hypothetical protein
MGGVAALAIPAAISAIGGIVGSRDAKKAAQAANRPQPYSETTTRSPWSTGQPFIEDVLRQAQSLYGRAPYPMVPSAWGRMIGPAQPQAPAGGGGGAAPAGPVNWQGRPRAEVQAVKQERRDARAARQQAPAPQPQRPSYSPGGAPAMGGGITALLLNRAGPFGAHQQIQQDLYSLLRGGGSPVAQAGSGYAQKLLGGGVVNPFVQALFDRISQWRPVGAPRTGGGMTSGGPSGPYSGVYHPTYSL